MLRFVTLLSLLALSFAARECGTRSAVFDDPTRIVGGVDADELEFPWQTSWRYFNATTNVHRHICGASIILDQWLVTAAHCVDINQDNTANPKLFKAGIGMHKQDTETPGGHQQTIDVDQIFLHPGWDSKTLENDIAVVKLTKPIGLATQTKVNAICVADPEDETDNRAAIISGWGLVKADDTSIPNVLQKADVKVEKQKTCESRYSFLVKIKASHICAGYNPTVCNGDSGGPLQYQKNGKFYLVGATSFGAGKCGSGLFPAVFTRVPYFIDWIEATTGQTLPK